MSLATTNMMMAWSTGIRQSVSITAVTLGFTIFCKTVVGQDIKVEFKPNPSWSEYQSVVVSYLPQTYIPLTIEDSEYAIQYEVASIRPLSGRDIMSQEAGLTKEENFVRSWFLAYKDVGDLSKFESVLSVKSFSRAEEQYASGERPRDWEYGAFEPYEDVRLLGLARYGYAYLFIVEMKRLDGKKGGNTAVRAILENGEYRQSGVDVPLDDATTGLTLGSTADLVIESLKLQIGR